MAENCTQHDIHIVLGFKVWYLALIELAKRYILIIIAQELMLVMRTMSFTVPLWGSID